MKNAALVQRLVKEGYIQSLAIKNAFLNIDRAHFVSDEWKEDAHKNLPLPIGQGRTIPQPLTVAFLLELLEPKFGEKILHLGVGLGWQTALLAYVVSEKSGKVHTEKNDDEGERHGEVIALEPVEEFSERATRNLETYHFISNGIAEVVHQSLEKGFEKKAPYDKIISSVSGDAIPTIWKEEVRIGGRIVAPVGESILVLDKKGPNSFSERRYFGFDLSRAE